MPLAWLEQSQGALAEAFAGRLCSRRGSVFQICGQETCRGLADAAISALRDDLAAGKREAIRVAMSAFVQELAPRGLTFADVRHYAQSLRTVVLGAVDAAHLGDATMGRRVDDWLYEVLAVGTMRFTAQREETLLERAAKQQVSQFEAQLGELRTAFEEKSRLLELIRQTSTPIVPVFDGILVVPLIGVFDDTRAQSLTEKLLQRVASAKAQAVIVDISGVPVFDGQAAQMVIRLTQAVRLLGTQLLLVGLSPEIARTIVELGVDLHGLKTLGSLQDGLAQALAVRRLRIAPLRPS